MSNINVNGNNDSKISIIINNVSFRPILLILFVFIIGSVAYIYWNNKKENKKFYIKLNKIFSTDVVKNSKFYKDKNCTNQYIMNYKFSKNEYLLSIPIDNNKDFKILFMKHKEYGCIGLNLQKDDTSPSFVCKVDCTLEDNKVNYAYCENFENKKASCERN